MSMRRKIISFLVLAGAMLTATDAVAQNPDIAGRRADIEEMLERGRWGEAYEALSALQSDVDPISMSHHAEWVEFQKVRTAVELGVAESEVLMENFITSHPTSIYRNEMLFMLASYYTDNGMMDEGERVFADVDYKSLDARARERYDMRVGYIRFKEGDYPRAKGHLAKVSK